MNPLIMRKGVCDPHIHIFENKAYLYATHDAPGYTENFCMEDWQIWSSEDFIDWRLERTILPEEFYCGRLDQCWALDAACKDGKYYLYFSTGDWGVGVAVADHPAGPFRDALGHALADYRVYPENIPKWDPHIFQDEDGSAYLIVGTCLQAPPWDCYLIARLTEDMIHLAEPFRRVEYYNNPCPEDKPSIHKFGGKYYLTHSSYYAIADNVYGPYVHGGNCGCNIDHGTFFTWHNQTYFATGGMDNANRYLRASYLAPCHYREDGGIVVDQKIMEYGCGQYDAAWEKIQASWYFKASGARKVEKKDGKFAVQLANGGLLYFPGISNVEEDTCLTVAARSRETAELLIYEGSPEGKLLGRCVLEAEGSPGAGGDGDPDDSEQIKAGIMGQPEKAYHCRLSCPAGKKNLCFKLQGEAELSWFAFDNGRKRYTMEPVFSTRGRGAVLIHDSQASCHQLLSNMELRGASMEVLGDGGAGGDGTLIVDYACAEKKVALMVHVNGEPQGTLEFPVTGALKIREAACQSSIPVRVRPGLNRIRLSSESFQEGRLGIDHVTLVTRESHCAVYPAANGRILPEGNGCWDNQPQWETEPAAFSGRLVKYLEKPGDSVILSEVDGGPGGEHLLEIHYCRGEDGDSRFELLVNGERKELSMESTGGFSVSAMKSLRVSIHLKSGKTNELCLRKTGEQDRGIYVDAFGVIPV